MSYNSKYKGSEVESLLDKVNGMGDIPTKVSQLENDVPYVTEDVVHNGVYAVDVNNKLIDYNTADSSCLGVALVAGEHKFMIAKSYATNDVGHRTLYWGKNLKKEDIAGIVTNGEVDGTNNYGYLPKPDGTFVGIPNLSGDFTTWTAGALSDFNGKDNTAGIINAYTEQGVSMDVRDMCSALNTFNTSDSHDDWYVPACGQLALMYLAKTEIEAALAKIGGTALGNEVYFSSSENYSDSSWSVNCKNGYVGIMSKQTNCRVWFVRDISVSKSLKERVSELESSKQDRIEDLDAIRDGASKGATALQEEQYKGTVTSVKINGVTKNPSNGVVDLGTISGGITSPLYPLRTHTMDDDNVSINPGEYHMWPAPMDSLTINLGGSGGGNIARWIFRFWSGNNGTTLTLPGGIRWANGKEISISANKIYEVSITEGLGVWTEF